MVKTAQDELWNVVLILRHLPKIVSAKLMFSIYGKNMECQICQGRQNYLSSLKSGTRDDCRSFLTPTCEFVSLVFI